MSITKTEVYYAKQIALKADEDTIKIIDIEKTAQKAAEDAADEVRQDISDYLSGYYNKTAVDSKIAAEASAREAADLTKSDKTTITSSADTSGTLTPANNTEVRYGAVTSLELTLPQSIPNDYISSVVFTSGQNSVNLTYPDTVQMTGEDCIDGIFVPAGGKRYTVILSYDGVYVSGVVGGVSI